KTALLAERDQLLHDRAQFLRLRQRGDDLLVLDQRRAHIGEHRAPVLGGAIELAVNPAVTHGVSLPLSFRTTRSVDPESRSTISGFRVCACARPGMTMSVLILEALGELVDILLRLARILHSEV